MQEHSRYEELCAAAGVGQISPEELRELQTHTESCNFCKELQNEFMEISSVWLTQAQKLEPEVYDPQSALRKNILRNLENAGAKFSAPVRKEISERPKRNGNLSFGWFHAPAPVWAAALIVVASAVGFGVGSFRHYSSATEKVATVASPAAPAAIIQKQAPARPADNPELLAAQHAEADLRQQLAASESAKTRLQKELTAVSQEIASLQATRDQDADTVAHLKAAAEQDHAAALATDAQLKSLKDAQASKDADLIATQYRIRELEGKLADRAAAEERDHELMALSSGSELRDVIASRNLHIIDVADVDRGGVRRPFGRVFYTEGKSLIFYAYDLSKPKGSHTFYAWGHREGDPHSTRGLGALQNDDEAQNRWVFRFNDTKVLAQIDSVYVTLEPSDRPGDKPKGHKLLNAFLGTPANHP